MNEVRLIMIMIDESEANLEFQFLKHTKILDIKLKASVIFVLFEKLFLVYSIT